MTMRVGLLMGIALLVGADDAANATKKELAKFEGTWKIESLEVNGQKLPEDVFKAARLVLKGDQFTYTSGAENAKGHFKVDVAQKPKTIDITFTEGAEKGKTIYGIYELEGDTYKVCLNVMGKDRPKEFATKPDSGFGLEVLKRVKP